MLQGSSSTMGERHCIIDVLEYCLRACTLSQQGSSVAVQYK